MLFLSAEIISMNTETIFFGRTGQLLTNCMLIGPDRDEQSAPLGSGGPPARVLLGKEICSPGARGQIPTWTDSGLHSDLSNRQQGSEQGETP